jgi:urease accessory protein
VPGWDGPAGLNGHRAVGQLLFVEPAMAARRAPVLLDKGKDGRAVLSPPAGGPARLANAVASNSSVLRELLDEAHAHGLGTHRGRAGA